MKRLLLAVAVLAGSMFALPTASQAQSAIVSGRVTTETGQAVPAATVAITAAGERSVQQGVAHAAGGKQVSASATLRTKA